MNKLFLIFLSTCPLFLNAQFYDFEHNLSDAEKIYGLSQFWSEAKYNFAFFDQTEVNWDSTYQAFIPRVLATKNTLEYYGELDKFCALLKDGHTDIWIGNEISKGQIYIRIFFKNINQRIYVEDIIKSDVEKIPLGSELIKIAGKPVKSFFEKNLFSSISASTEHEKWNEATRAWFYHHLKDTTDNVELELLRPDGETVKHLVRLYTTSSKGKFTKKYPEWQAFAYEALPNDIAKIDFNTFADTIVIEKFKEVLPNLYKSKGIIIDLRKNGGGNSAIGAEILKYFTEQEILHGSVWQTREHKAAYKAWGKGMVMEENFDGWTEEEIAHFTETYEIGKGIHWYKGDTMSFKNDVAAKKIKAPLVILFGNNTGSAAEDFLIILDGIKDRATTIGQKSFGSTGQPISFQLPGGAWARICTKKDTYPDGREFVGYGISPNIFVPETLEEMIENKDNVLDKAIEVLREKMK